MSDEPQSNSRLEVQAPGFAGGLAEPRDQLLSRASALFGAALTTVILTGTWPDSERPGVPAQPMSDRQETTLRHAVNIAEGLLSVEASATIQAWFVGRNPLLNDRAPAIVVSSAPDAVREAAEYFLVYG